MYQKLKHFVLTLIFLTLWARYFAAMFDPLAGGLELSQGLSIYQDWRAVFDWIYVISGYLMWPVSFAVALLSSTIPQITQWTGFTLQQTLQWIAGQQALASQPQIAQALESPLTQKIFVGYVDFLVPVTIILYRLLGPLMDAIYDFFKNILWNILIEFSFTQKKEAKYQEVLEKRAADLMKLNVQYRNLSKEADMLAQSVITDELTKVYNKRFFINKITEVFQQAKQRKTVLAIAMVDIDHFKKLNDNYGHLLGDKVLQAVAQVAKRGTPGDCFCCRFGGEEFAIIMPGKTIEQVLQIVGTVHQNLPLLRFEEDPNLRTSASFGICLADFKVESAQELKSFEDFIKLADDELYRAKLNGRNRIEHNLLQ